jgi:hypothetical protein
MNGTLEIIDATRCSRAYGEIRSGWRTAAALAIVLTPFWFDRGTRLAILASCVLSGLAWSMYHLKSIATVVFSISLGFLMIYFLWAVDLWKDHSIKAVLIAIGASGSLGHAGHAVFTYKQCLARRSLSELLQPSLGSSRTVPWRVVSASRVAQRILGATLTAAASVLLVLGFGLLFGLWQSKQELFLGFDPSLHGIVQFVSKDPHFIQLIQGLLIAAGLIWLGFWLLRYARRFWTLRAEELLRKDLRRPILILRSFRDDMLAVDRDDEGIIERIRSITLSQRHVFEETITKALANFGPVIAIGRPGEMLPALGAAREYLSDNVWKERATELVAQSSIVTVILGRGDSLRWEMERLFKMEALCKVIAVFPPLKRDELVARWKIVGASFNIQDRSIVSFLRGSGRCAMVATFDEMKRPVLIVAASTKDTSYREAVLEGACRILKTMRPASTAI